MNKISNEEMNEKSPISHFVIPKEVVFRDRKVVQIVDMRAT